MSFDEPSNTSQKSQQDMYQNPGYYSANALQIRLNVDPVVRQIEMYLKGKRYERKIGNDDIPYYEEVSTGEPLANAIGIQSIMSRVESIFNPMTVQGNFLDYDMYANYLIRVRDSLAMHLMINMLRFEIKSEDYAEMISMIMGFIEAFMTRLIGNKERESFTSTIRSVESNTVQSQNKGFKLPFIG